LLGLPRNPFDDNNDKNKAGSQIPFSGEVKLLKLSPEKANATSSLNVQNRLEQMTTAFL
jgi:hypothetical protein